MSEHNGMYTLSKHRHVSCLLGTPAPPPPLSGSVLPLSVCVFRLQARLHPKQHLLFPASCINEGADAARLSGNESGRTKGRLALHADGSAAPEVSF